MNQNVKLWLRAANPFTPPRGMIEAQRAARVGAVALGMGVLQLLVGLLSMPKAADLTRVLLEKQGQAVTETQLALQEAIVGMMPMATLVFTLVFAVGYVVLAVVQWRRLTWVIPAIMLAFIGYGILSGFGALLQFGAVIEWEFAYSSALMWLVNLVTIALYAAAFRGGRMLEKLKRTY